MAVRRDSTKVAEALVIMFDKSAVLDEQRGLGEVASRLESHENMTISGANGLFGTASDGSHGFVVYKNGVALIVFGPDRATLQQITEKLLVNVA